MTAILGSATLQSAAAANGNGTVFDVSGAGTAVLSVVSATSMSGGTTVNFEVLSPDGTTWVPIKGYSVATGAQATTTTADGDFRFNVAGYRSLRARISAYSAGVTTIKGTATSISGDSAPSTTVVVDSELPAAAALADATANPTVPAVGTFGHSFGGTTWDRIRSGLSAATSTLTGYINMLPFGKYNATPPTLSDGQSVIMQVDSAGNQKVSLATLVEGEDQTLHRMGVLPKYNFVAISTATTTVVKGSAGVLQSITVTGGTAGTIIIYDNTSASGTIIASFDSTNVPMTYFFNAIAATGITIITSAATKLSVSYL